MTQYIDKSALVAEIKRRKEINKYRDTNDSLFEDEAILSFLNSLEVKEVDLKKEKSAWSEEDEKMLNYTISTVKLHLNDVGSDKKEILLVKEEIDWLKSLKERMNLG